MTEIILNSTNNANLDLFTQLVRGINKNDLTNYLDKSWELSKIKTLAIIFNCRDRLKGKKEKEISNYCILWLKQYHNNIYKKHILIYINEYGCWNDLNYIIKRVMNENEDTSMDEYINWDIKSVDCEGSYLGNMSSMGVSEDKDGNPKVFIRYCKGDNEELNYLKRKARREIEQSNQLPSDNESLFENKNMKNKKVIKLSENDLYRIVKRVINEQASDSNRKKSIQCFLSKKGLSIYCDSTQSVYILFFSINLVIFFGLSEISISAP